MTQEIDAIWRMENPGFKSELMTTKEVCKYFGKTKDTIRRWSNEGKLTRKHIGKSVFYERSEVENLAQ